MDEDLRELERAAQRGDPDARGRLLAAWRRAGRLEEDRLVAAARLGDPVARALLGAGAPAVAKVLVWLESVREQPWAVEVTLLAAAVSARVALEMFERQFPEDRGPRRCVEAAEAYVGCPCPTHGDLAQHAGDWQDRAAVEQRRRLVHRADQLARPAERAAIWAAQAAGLRQAPDRARMLAVLAVEEALQAADPVRDATRAALSRWLLGA